MTHYFMTRITHQLFSRFQVLTSTTIADIAINPMTADMMMRISFHFCQNVTDYNLVLFT